MERYTFRCPVCSKLFEMDQPGEPVCTGPSETRDDHEMIIMRLHSVCNVEVNPVFAWTRADGPLLMPEHPVFRRRLQREARKILGRG